MCHAETAYMNVFVCWRLKRVTIYIRMQVYRERQIVCGVYTRAHVYVCFRNIRVF